jgi:WD40 repeat protein
VTAPADNTAWVWDTATASRTRLAEHSKPVRAAAFCDSAGTPDGTIVATGSADGTARTWKLTTVQVRGSRLPWSHPVSELAAESVALYDHEAPVNHVAFSPDGLMLATAGGDSLTRIWDTVTTRRFTTLAGHDGPVNAVAFSPDGNRLATASDDGTIRLWNPRTGRGIATIIPLPEDGYAVLFPDGAYKLEGDPGESFWWAMKLCRFAPGELDRYFPRTIRRLPRETLIREPS